MKIGGRAYKNGVRLVGPNYSVKAYYQDGELKYSIGKKVVKNNKFLSLAKKTPIIRGVFSLFTALISFFKEATGNPRRYWLILLLLVIDIIIEGYLILMPESSNALLKSIPDFNIYFDILILGAIAFLLRGTLLKETFKFHGAEHKAVNYYEDNFAKPLMVQSRLANRCGTNLVVFYMILLNIFIFTGININEFLANLLAIGIAYEVISYAPDSILSVAYLVQCFTTIEPDEKHLKASATALRVLIAKETGESPPSIIV
ncbi:metal-dependent enzyme [Orenia metallireducens]|uniref:Metal-dependent enzyme n=1 Tax=Orenia metallireducens TaxID=1413210 RepID=A0A1C0A878_9FIRM|nr:DUF1385 domain-containing protein [Orenia metallireducens]OCL26428.1 metal-dependent enzyme [Orenia metallireducens]